MINNILTTHKKEIKKAILIRLVEERLLSLFSEGALNGTVHTAVGQEFTGVFISKYLKPNDFVTSNHRGHGHYLAKFGNVRGLISEIMGKDEGVSGGFGGSQHIVDENYLSNGIQGGMLPVAAGVSFYLKKKEINSISVSYIGDGTLGEGIVYETLNLASVLKCPFLVVVENNGYAQSTSFKQTFRGDLKERAVGFGVKYFESSTWDLQHLDESCKAAIEFARVESKPVIIEIKTYRLNSHSKGDDNRIKNEIEEFRSRDILTNILNSNDGEITAYVAKTKVDIESIIVEIRKGSTLTTTYQSDKLNSKKSIPIISKEIMAHDRYNALIYKALNSIFIKNENVILIGEDIQNKTEFSDADYGGAFKVSKDLSDLFPGRVLNTPISEAAICGFVAGYSIKAGTSFVEIMFGDFTTLIFDQILQHASKFETMFNGKVTCPIVIRTPMGGKRGYGPTHSQSIEKFFLGIDNFAVVALHHRICPEYIFNAIMTVRMPLMVIENKILYTIDTAKKKLPTYKYDFDEILFPELFIKPKEHLSSVTILCYGETLNVVEDALLELLIDEEIFCDVICPSLISEINTINIISSLSLTRKLLIIEEGCGYASWGSEIISKIHEQSFSDFKLKRFHNSQLIPSSFKAEIELLPNKVNVKNIILELI
jgi:2-oxoisovalerate dehydrogenase E1 component